MHVYIYIAFLEPVMSIANQGNMVLFAGETYDFSSQKTVVSVHLTIFLSYTLQWSTDG